VRAQPIAVCCRAARDGFVARGFGLFIVHRSTFDLVKPGA